MHFNSSADSAPGVAPASGSRVRWHRTVAVGFAILFAILTGWAFVMIRAGPIGTDFLSFWAAAKLALTGPPALAYDLEVHRALEKTVVKFEGILSFPYPPPFLLAVMPFGLGPYWVGFAAFVLVTGGLYLAVPGPVDAFPYRMAHPQVFVNATSGQNGFLTSAIFIAGTTMLERRPMLGGAILGLMVIKPQLGILFPLALLAGRQWRAIFGAAMGSLGALLIALLVLGPQVYVGFWKILPMYTNSLAISGWPWNELATPFAFLRHIGVPTTPALLVHAAIALPAAALVWRAWRRDLEQKVPILAAAMLLVPPYLLTYDALLLVVPMGWLMHRERHPGIIAAAFLFCILPIATYFDAYPGPNTIPIAAILCLWALHADERAGRSRLTPALAR